MTYRVAVDDIVGSFSNRIASHKTGWARMERCIIQDMCDRTPNTEIGDEVRLLFSGEREQVADAATWMISHDMAFDGKHYNLFGGWSADIHQSLLRFLEHPNVISLGRPMPDLEACLRARAEKTQSNLSDLQWEKIRFACKRVPTINHEDLVSGGVVVLGDSHAVAQYRRDRLVLRNDGLTLHRLVTDGLEHWLGALHPNHLVIQAGNIDIRHHLLRQDDPRAAAEVLYLQLYGQLEDLIEDGRILSYEIVAPYPIEFEDRRIPKTGYYKGTPFYGSLVRRAELGFEMEALANAVFGLDHVFQWPSKWFDLDPEEYANTYMERPGSVHLSPEWHLWDYIDNKPNAKLLEEYA